MVILLDRLIIESDCPIRHRNLVELIVEAVMGKIMANACD